MSTVTQTIESKWYCQYKNGNDFSLMPVDFSGNMLGSVFEKVKLVSRIRTFTVVTIEDYYFTAESIHMPNASLNTYLRVGDKCQIYFPGDPGWIFIFTITSISKEIIYFTVDQSNIPTPFPINGVKDYIHVLSDLTFLKYDYGLKGSDVQEFYQSYLDDESNTFLVDNIGLRPTPLDPRDTGFSIGTKSNINSNDGTIRVRYIENNIVPIANVGTIESAQDFEIEHIFTIQDYTEDQIQNYEDGSKPSRYIGEVTLDYNAKFEFRTVETNPDTAKLGTFLSKGNVAFINENFNGRPNKFNVSNIQIMRKSNMDIIDEVPSGETAILSFTITSSENSFVNPPVVVLQHFAMISDYAFKQTRFTDLFKQDNLRLEGISNIFNGSVIKNASIVSGSNNEINISCEISVNDISYEGEYYLIYALVGNSSLSSVVSDRVPLKIKVGQYDDGFDIEGLIESPELRLFTRDCNYLVESGFSSFSIINAELIYTKFNFSVVDGEIYGIKLLTVGFESGNNYEIDSIDIDISGFIIVGGVQRIDETLSTPYSFGDNGYIKWIANKDYEIVFPYRMPYSKLIPVSGLSEILFDQNEPNNGYNESVFYQESKGINIHISYMVTMLKDGRLTDYLFRSPVIDVLDFETTL